MKVKKFNESNNWTVDSLVNFYKNIIQIRKEEQNIDNLLVEFFKYDINYIDKFAKFGEGLTPRDADEIKNSLQEGFETNISFGFGSFGSSLNSAHTKLKIYFNWDDGDESASIEPDDELLSDIVRFMNDPEAYRDAKKYNL